MLRTKTSALFVVVLVRMPLYKHLREPYMYQREIGAHACVTSDSFVKSRI